jgi:hypothetical protein
MRPTLFSFLHHVLLASIIAVAAWGCSGTAHTQEQADGGPQVDAAKMPDGMTQADAEVQPDAALSTPNIFTLIWGGASPAWYAKFDLVINRDSKAIEAKQINPDLKVATLCDTNACGTCLGGMECPSEWCVRTPNGSPKMIYQNTYCLGDTSDQCEPYEGQTYREKLIEVAQQENWSEYDGWVSGGTWANVQFLNPPIDINKDGVSDSTDHQLWKNGQLALLQELRTALGDERFIILNPGTLKTYWGEGPKYINGSMAEKFMFFSIWDRSSQYDFLTSYALYAETGIEPHMTLVDNHFHGDPDPDGRSKNNFRFMRFGLAATLLYDGYYSYKDGVSLTSTATNEHYFNRYYDEFDVPLGDPLAPYVTIKDEVFCRFFQGGVMILNGSTTDHTVTEAELQVAAAEAGLDWSTIAGTDGHYYRFSGQQNPEFNNGSQFDEILLKSKATTVEYGVNPSRKGDGILLVRQEDQVVMASVIIDTEDFVTSPGAENAVLNGFDQSCDFQLGFRTGGVSCSMPSRPYRGHARADAGSQATATFEVVLVHDGVYRVSEYHPAMDANNVSFTVLHADGEETFVVDQSADAERWNLVGEFNFGHTSPAQVIVSAAGAQGSRVAADAIRFEWVVSQ